MRDETFDLLVAALIDGGVPFDVLEHKPVFTSAEAAEVRGTPLHSGAKALLLRSDDVEILVVMPADLALDSGALRRALGLRRVRFATREELHERTGVVPGAVPPFGSLWGLATVCDERLADNEHIHFNAGSNTRSMRVSYRDWVRFENPRLERIARLTN